MLTLLSYHLFSHEIVSLCFRARKARWTNFDRSRGSAVLTIVTRHCYDQAARYYEAGLTKPVREDGLLPLLLACDRRVISAMFLQHCSNVCLIRRSDFSISTHLP